MVKCKINIGKGWCMPYRQYNGPLGPVWYWERVLKSGVYPRADNKLGSLVEAKNHISTVSNLLRIFLIKVLVKDESVEVQFNSSLLF